MLKIFDKSEFLNLANQTGKPVISIFFPTNKHSTDNYKEDKLHYKNLLSSVETDLLKTFEFSQQEVKSFLSEAKNLLEDTETWRYNASMVAIYIIDGKVTRYTFAIELAQPSYFISERPMMNPIIPELNDDGHYYALLLNLDRIRLFEGTRESFNEIHLDEEEVAVSFTAEEELDENQSALQGQGNVGTAGAIFHGQGAGSDEEKKVTIENYFHRMTNMLEPKLNKNPLPMYLIGVDYLIPIFKKVSKYNRLMNGHVSGSYTGKAPQDQELHKKIWEIASDYFQKERLERKEEFSAKRAANLVVGHDRLELIKAALTGAVDTLIVDKHHKHLRGTYDENKHLINLDEEKNSLKHCLIDFAAMKTLENGGKVYMVDSEYLPDDKEAAATLRYSLQG